MKVGDLALLRGTVEVTVRGEPQGDPPRVFCKITSNGNTGAFLVSDLSPIPPVEPS